MNLKEQLVKDIETLETLATDKKEYLKSQKDSVKPIQNRISTYAKAIKDGCVTPDDYNKWAAKEF